MSEFAGDHLLKISEAAAVLGISRGSLYRLAASRAVVSYKLEGVGLRFKPSDLDRFIAKGRRAMRDAAAGCPKN